MKILQAADAVIDAFGTAKSLNNNSSSRFGKYLEIYYGDSTEIKGAIIKTYLLEKGRVIQSHPSESNFTIFHLLTNCKSSIFLSAQEYTYLRDRSDRGDPIYQSEFKIFENSLKQLFDKDFIETIY